LTAHLRNPEKNAPPSGVEDRRLGIYRELIYNNLEGFLASGFPILREIIEDTHWHAMVRDFLERHQSHSPYFLEITQEFLQYLQEERGDVPGDPVFMLELAHYEWVELALDVSEEEWPSHVDPEGDLLLGQPVVSPLAWNLSYQYPVHRIGPDFQPDAPGAEPTFLIVYRDQQDAVQFMAANAVTVRLIQLLSDEGPTTGREALSVVAAELQHPDPTALEVMGLDLLQTLRSKDILCGTLLA
jgi:hypothetical protein